MPPPSMDKINLEKCSIHIIDAIDKSQKSILVQAYTFTSKPIAKSLIRAKERGVSVAVILDESQLSSKYSVISYLFAQEIPIYIDYKPAIAHNKVMIIDNKKVLSGSFNFTHSAEFRNTENLLIIENNDMLIRNCSSKAFRLLSLVAGSAPCSNRNLINSKCPLSGVECSAIDLNLLAALTSIPPATKELYDF
ncbi:Phospholipase D/Transphosphatidylase,Phospholipase D-like domain [Cinara cedri]|uniref:Mitochondrial cardiolipin hydrolase n=1 Tax=Cinara cedri TaxID=506608 RepID=A0A5E4MUK2_9HEMI|nr:Phospholipase D/Transphosphatidylase,Phospholipase D-like domain [Cinara cedri]